ncbi:MAG: response regulator [Planctomycetes bacterium]|nr:response regulator [Planctomycetota bacterium]
MKAIIIDDSRAVRSMLKRMLVGLGFETTEAGDGQQALDRLAENPDLGLALVDWNMPVMNGYEFIKAVRADSSWNHMKIIMVTTETEIVKMMAALNAGADEWVMKPFTAEVIAEKIRLSGIKTI